MQVKLTYEELDNIASGVQNDGVIYLPYLIGERTPHLDPDCRGAFVGLSAGHNTANMYRAVLEGVSMSIRDCYELIHVLGLD